MNALLRTAFPLLLTGTVLWSLATATVPAVSPERDAPPRVTAYSYGSRLPRSAVLLPFADAPGYPGSGRSVTDAFRRALERRGVRTSEASLPRDAAGAPTPAPLVADPRLAEIGRESNAEVALGGRVLDFRLDQEEYPYVTLQRRGVYVDLPPETRIASRVSVSVRAVDAESGRLAFQATGSIGPTQGLAVEDGMDRVVEAMLDRWFLTAR